MAAPTSYESEQGDHGKQDQPFGIAVAPEINLPQ